MNRILICLLFVGFSSHPPQPQPNGDATEPSLRHYPSLGGVQLKAFLFPPRGAKPETRHAAIVIFHGGGWTRGDPEWAFPLARHFSDRGMVAIAAEYRLSDHGRITPEEAVADAKAVIQWLRRNAPLLETDPNRVAAYGWSAGAHLAVSAAIFEERGSDGVSSAPNALVLVSPAVSLAGDNWFRNLLRKGTQVRAVSPDEHVREGLPPVLILQGDVDSVTPLAGVKRFCERLESAGNTCEMHVYKGFGHLFTPAGVPDEWPKPDPPTRADALGKADRFLESLGF